MDQLLTFSLAIMGIRKTIPVLFYVWFQSHELFHNESTILHQWMNDLQCTKQNKSTMNYKQYQSIQ